MQKVSDRRVQTEECRERVHIKGAEKGCRQVQTSAYRMVQIGADTMVQTEGANRRRKQKGTDRCRKKVQTCANSRLKTSTDRWRQVLKE